MKIAYINNIPIFLLMVVANTILELIPLLILSRILDWLSSNQSPFSSVGSSSYIEFGVLGLCAIILLSSKFWVNLNLHKNVQSVRHIFGMQSLEYLKYNRSESDGKIDDNARLVLSEADFMVNSLARPVERIISSSFLFLAIFVFLLYQNALLAFAGVLAATPFLIFFLAIRSYIRRLGESRSVANKNRFNSVVEFLQVWREARVFNFETRVLKSFEIASVGFYKAVAANYAVNTFPKFLIEVVFVLGVALILFADVNNVTSGRLGSISSPDIGVFVLGIFKILPALNQFFSALSMLKFGEQAHQELLEQKASQLSGELESDEPISHKLCVEELEYTLGDQTFAFDSFTFEKRNVITGPSGSGKSSLMDALIGLKNSTTYKVRNASESYLTPENVISRASFCPQFPRFFDQSVEENIVCGQQKCSSRLSDVLEICQIDFPVDQRVNNFQNSFSGGQLLRIGLARALYKKSEILFLDEPNSAIGSDRASAILSAIDDYYDGILVLTTHDKSIVSSLFNQIDIDEKRRK